MNRVEATDHEIFPGTLPSFASRHSGQPRRTSVTDTRIYDRESKRNAVADWLEPVLLIPEVPVSNFYPDTGNPD